MWRRGIVLGTTRMLGRRNDGPPVYTYEAVPGVPPVSTMRLGRSLSEVQPGAHSHDFLVLAYVERGGGSMWLEAREWQIEAGDVYLIAPGEVVEAGDAASGLHGPEGWAVFFQPEVLGSQVPAHSSPGAPTARPRLAGAAPAAHKPSGWIAQSGLLPSFLAGGAPCHTPVDLSL